MSYGSDPRFIMLMGLTNSEVRVAAMDYNLPSLYELIHRNDPTSSSHNSRVT